MDCAQVALYLDVPTMQHVCHGLDRLYRSLKASHIYAQLEDHPYRYHYPVWVSWLSYTLHPKQTETSTSRLQVQVSTGKPRQPLLQLMRLVGQVGDKLRGNTILLLVRGLGQAVGSCDRR